MNAVDAWMKPWPAGSDEGVIRRLAASMGRKYWLMAIAVAVVAMIAVAEIAGAVAASAATTESHPEAYGSSGSSLDESSLEHDADAGHDSGGLPQLDSSSFPAQLLWLAITFSLCYFLLSGVALPRVGGVIAARERKIADDLDQADELRTQAEKLALSSEQKLHKAQEQAQIEFTRAFEEAESLRVARLAELEDHLSVRIAHADGNIARARSEILSHVEQAAANLTCEVMGKLSGQKFTVEQALSVVKQVDRQGAGDVSREQT